MAQSKRQAKKSNRKSHEQPLNPAAREIATKLSEAMRLNSVRVGNTRVKRGPQTSRSTQLLGSAQTAAEPRLALGTIAWLGSQWIQPRVSIFVDRIEPTPLIEGRKARVFFGVSNTTQNTLTNLTVTVRIRPQYFPSDVNNVSEYSGLYFWTVPSLDPWAYREGIITFVVPPASKRTPDEPPPNVLEVVLSQYQEPTADQIAQAAAVGAEIFGSWVEIVNAGIRFDSGARYRLTVTGISIAHIASLLNDTVFVGVGGDAAGIPAPGQSENLGDNAASPRLSQIPVRLNGVGYFDSVCDGNNDTYTLSYVVANMGNADTPNNLREALNWISRIAAVIATAFTAGVFAPLWGALDYFTEWLNSFIGSCNRMVAQGLDTFGSWDLFEISYDEFQIREATPLPPASYSTPRGSDEGRSCKTSYYYVVRSILRDRRGMEFVDLSRDANQFQAGPNPLFITLAYGGSVNLDSLVEFTAGNLVLELGTAQRAWAVEYGNGYINKGTLIAPPSSVMGDAGEFCVVTLTLLKNGAEAGNGFIVIRYTT
jgi:hypothetical protein